MSNFTTAFYSVWQLFECSTLYSDTRINIHKKNSQQDRINYQLNLHKSISLVLVICLIFSGCASANFNKAEVLQASSYKYSCSMAGLIISADPFIEENRVNKVFGYDLLSKGILPVLVVLENKTADDGYVLLNEQSRLLIKYQVIQNPKNNTGGNIQSVDEIKNSANVQAGFTLAAASSITAGSLATTAGAASLTAGAALGIAGFAVLLIPAAIAGNHQVNLLRIQQNMIDNELTNNRPLYNGGSNSGFLYMKIDNKEDVNKIEGLMLYLKNIRSSEIQAIKIDTK